MIDLHQELSAALPASELDPGTVERARTAARSRRKRTRTVRSVATVVVVLGLVAGAWAVVASRTDRRQASVATGPDVGADAPTALTVVCTAEGPVLNSDIVQVGPAGLPVEWRNDTDAPASFFMAAADGTGGGTGGLVQPDDRENHVLAIPPGRVAVECGADTASRRSAEVTLADPRLLYSSVELDCGNGGQTIVDLSGDGAPVADPEDALRGLLSDDALADESLQPAGYPQSDPRPYVVRQDGRVVARPGFSETPEGLILVELDACRTALGAH